MSLRFRLNLMIMLTMLVMISVGTLFMLHHARRSVSEEVRSSVGMAMQLIDAGLGYTRGNEGALTSWLVALAGMEKTRHLRIRVQQASRAIVNPSFATRPKTEARVPAWFTWAVTPQLIVGEKQIQHADGRPIQIMIEADPQDEIAEAWSEAHDFLYLMALLTLSVYLLIHFILGRAFKSVGVILRGLEDIEHGHYDKRLPDFSVREFERISQAFNHAAEVLAKARDENSALTRQLLNIQEEERRYLAQELHDELGQCLSAIKIMAASLRKPIGGGAGTEAVEAIIATCDRLFGVVRAMMRRLRPMLLDELGLAAALEDMIAHWRERNPGVWLSFRCTAGVDACPGGTRIQLFRVVQECLTNVARHAQASNVRIHLWLAEEETPASSPLILEVSDDGRGFDPDRPVAGFGILGMRERVARLSGDFSLTTRPGQGVRIEVRVPRSARIPHA